MTIEQNILTTEEKGAISVDIACTADLLKAIERVSMSGDDATTHLLVSGLVIHTKRLYAISERLSDISEIKEVA